MNKPDSKKPGMGQSKCPIIDFGLEQMWLANVTNDEISTGDEGHDCKWLQETECKKQLKRVPKQEKYRDCQLETYRVSFNEAPVKQSNLLCDYIFLSRIVIMRKNS